MAVRRRRTYEDVSVSPAGVEPESSSTSVPAASPATAVPPESQTSRPARQRAGRFSELEAYSEFSTSAPAPSTAAAVPKESQTSRPARQRTSRFGELDAHCDFFTFLIDRMSPTNSKILPEELKKAYAAHVDQAIRIEEAYSVAEVEKDYLRSTTNNFTYSGRTLPQYCILLILLMIPMLVLFFSEMQLTGVPKVIRRLIENASTGYLWILFIPSLAWLIFSDKINKDLDPDGKGIKLYIGLAVIAILTILSISPFGLRLIWIQLYAVVNAFFLIWERITMYHSLCKSVNAYNEQVRLSKKATEDFAVVQQQLVTTAQQIDAFYQSIVDRLNQHYGTDYRLPEYVPWWKKMREVSAPERRFVPASFLSEFKEKTVFYYSDKDSIIPNSNSTTMEIRFENYETSWFLMTYDSAVKLIDSGRMVPLFGVTYPLENLNSPRFVFMTRKATWKMINERETITVTKSTTPVEDTERQEQYKRNNLFNDISYLGDTIENLQFDRNPDIALPAMDIQNYREKKISGMTQDITETDVDTDTRKEVTDMVAYGGIVVMDVQKKRVVEVFYFKSLREGVEFAYEYLKGPERATPGYYNYACDDDSANYIARTAVLTWETFQTAYKKTYKDHSDIDVWE